MRTPAIALLFSLAFSLATTPSGAQEEGWDVTEPFGPTSTLSFDVQEGTWMNVDVSPDGRTIVFDLLGDLYTVPVEGGAATRITSGLAFDMQPRFRPDGSGIAFVSDRDGAQNLWLVEPDGSGAVQLSHERERELSSPAWSADGRSLFARKHFVDTRSLGAGEIWSYHVSGSGGLQVTERDGWQKDQGEPAPSPDGRFLYYSQDVTPGTRFEYNKDPYGTIYAIRRHDLETGEETTVTARPGGSVTPRVSPDGRRMAFVRRVRLTTVLFLRDLATGEEWPLWDGLSRDNQEAWSIHGVYPQYAWLPDGSGLVIWARGRIWRVDATTGEARTIPFQAHVEQTVHEAVRVPVDPHPERFRVRMLRDVTTRPGGGQVAYGALGRIWVKDLAGGAPRAVGPADRMAFDPSWAPDGTRLAYATWTDADGGRIRVSGVDGRPGRDVVTERGHYIEPAFSPDGRWIVYRKATGDAIRGRTFARGAGIWVVPADGSAPPRRVPGATGVEPRFDPTGSRIFLRASRDGGTALVSVDLDGTDEVVHFTSENAVEIVPSPDGRWVAFVERFRAWVAAFPRTGRTVALGPGARGYPLRQVSANAGSFLHWSSDSRTLHWSLGPEYFTRSLERTFSFVEGGAEEPDDPEEEGIDISFEAEADVPTGRLALVGGRVITMDAESRVLENATVLVEGNRIAAVGPSGEVEVPAGAHRIDVRGRTLMPGLVDVHAHVGGERDGILAEASWPLMANVAFGVTTSHDPSNDTETVFSNAELVRTGRKLGPRLFSTGTILYGAEGPARAVVDSYDDALKHVARMKAVGAFTVKSYNQRRRAARQMIVRAARELGVMVHPEGGSLVYNNMTMVHDGHTGVEHSLPVPAVHEDLATLFGRSGTGYTPTMVVGFGGLSGEYFWYERTNVWEDEHLLGFVPRDVVDPRARRRLKAAGDGDFNHVAIAQGAKAILDAGGRVHLGAHGQLQGLAAHWELWMFTQGGMTNMEALRAGTISGAEYLGMEADLGSIEVGKLADLLVLDGDPLDDIQDSRNLEWVVLNGRIYDAKTLNQAGNHPGPRLPLPWERPPSSR